MNEVRFGVIFQSIEVEAKHWADIVAIVKGEPVGCCRLSLDSTDCPTLSDVGVAEDYRNKGFGSSLIEGAVKIAADRGKKAVSLYVAKKNEGAVRLYRRLGFVIYADNADGFFMSRSLVK